MMSTILSQRSSIPSQADNRTKYCRKTLQSRDATCTRVSLMPSRSDWKTSGFKRSRISGKSTSVNMAVHSLWSLQVSSGERRVLWSELSDTFRTSRHGFVH